MGIETPYQPPQTKALPLAYRAGPAAEPEYDRVFMEATDPGVFDRSAFLRELFAKPNVSPDERRRAIQKHINGLRGQQAELGRKLAPIEEEHAHLQKLIAAYKSLVAWVNAGDLRLERPETSRLHQFMQDVVTHRCPVFQTRTKHADTEDFLRLFGKESHVILIQHDWATAFKGAGDFADGSFKLPYPVCCFEFRLSGKHALICALQEESGHIEAMVAIEHEGAFYPDTQSYSLDGSGCRAAGDGEQSLGGIMGLFAAQVRAACIALDADVVESAVVRAPHALNQARIKAGKLPIFEHRILSLTRRHRSAAPPLGGQEQRRRRLHFRRGHWRHYATFKTWVRWTLVGDPDLGFVEKEYRL